MDCIQAIMTRRSVRRFAPDAVTREQLEVVLRAAMAAPSAGNERPWRFVVVRDPDVLVRLSKATPFAKPLAHAPVGLVVCADRVGLKYPGFWRVDCAAAIENALLAAHATGLGGVWIGVHPIGPFVRSVRRAVGVPRHVVPMSMVALGRPVEPPPAVDRFELRFIHEERWGGGSGS